MAAATTTITTSTIESLKKKNPVTRIHFGIVLFSKLGHFSTASIIETGCNSLNVTV